MIHIVIQLNQRLSALSVLIVTQLKHERCVSLSLKSLTCPAWATVQASRRFSDVKIRHVAPQNTYHPRTSAGPCLKPLEFFPSSEAWVSRSLFWAQSFLFRWCRRASGGTREPPAPRGSPPRGAGTDARRDTASGRPAGGHPRPAWRGAGRLEVSASAQVRKMKEKKSWRERTSEPKSGAWSDRSPQVCLTGNGHSEKIRKRTNYHIKFILMHMITVFQWWKQNLFMLARRFLDWHQIQIAEKLGRCICGGINSL